MIKTDRYLYGTVEECVNEIWKRIDFDMMTMPSFDFCYNAFDNAEEDVINAKDASDLGDGWFGCKANYEFDPQRNTLNLIFGFYGGGAFYALCVYDDGYKKDLVDEICYVADLTPDSYTVIDFNVE